MSDHTTSGCGTWASPVLSQLPLPGLPGLIVPGAAQVLSCWSVTDCAVWVDDSADRENTVLSLEEFVRDLAANQLVSAEEVRAVEAASPPERRPRDSQALAKELVRAGRLTKYQAANAVQGKSKNLVFDDFVVLDTWSAGGPQCYQAENRKMKQRRVALRILPPFAATKSSTALARFQREVQAAARLEHPHLLAAYHAGEAHGAPYLVFQFVDGQDLESLVRQEGRMPVEKVLDFVLQAARALAYAHDKGVVHRDVNPTNLLVDKSGTVKVAGLGLARIEDDTEKGITQTGELIGRPEYMPPEQWRSAKNVDARSDVYSLGCTLYYLLTGKTIYTGETVGQQMTAHTEQPIPNLRSQRPDVPASLETVFAKMVAKSPNERYTTMGAAIAALENCQKAAGKKVGKLVEKVASEHTWTATSKFVGGLFVTIVAPVIVGVLMKVLDNPPDPAPGAPTSTTSPASAIQSDAAVAPVVPLVTAPKPSGAKAEVALAAAGNSNGAVGLPPAKLVPTQPELLFPENQKDKPPALAKMPFAQRSNKARQVAQQQQNAWSDYLGVPLKATNTIGMSLVLIPPGTFPMGSTDQQIEAASETAKKRHESFVCELPQHTVTLTRPFYMSATEVTIGQFRTFVDATGHKTEAEQRRKATASWKLPGHDINDDSPVSVVTWSDAVQFCNWLSDHEGLPRAYVPHKQNIWEAANTPGYRLPSEAQWEFACRAGMSGNYGWGEKPEYTGQFAWAGANTGGRPHAVGTKAENGFGLFDMHGNVAEWCNDWFDEKYYASSMTINPEGPSSGIERVFRGGGFNAMPAFYRSAVRLHSSPGVIGPVKGFRVIRNGPAVSKQ